MKKIRNHSFVFLFITIIVLYFILKDNFHSILDVLSKMNLFWLLIAIIIIFIYWILKTLSMFYIVKEYSKKMSFKTILKQTIITQFFNGITPFSTGGQPMEIYMLKKCNISVAKATNIVLQNSMVYQVALVIYGIIAILLNFKYKLFYNIQFLNILVALGFLINTIVCIIIFVISFSTKLSNIILMLVSKVGNWFKIIVDQEKFMIKYSKKVNEFHESAKIYKSNKLLFIKGIVINLIALTLLYILPFFLMLGMNENMNMTIIEAITTSAYVLLIGSFVPIPGGSGGIEYAFLKFFGVFFNNITLSALLIVWRFITYYLGIILGGVLFSFYKEGE